MDCKGDPAVSGARLDPVMLGRGLVSDPELAGRLKSAGAAAGRHDDAATNEDRNADANGTSAFAEETDYAKFRRFHDTLYHEYQKVLSPDINVLHKMRELWTYWQVLFDGKEREIKRLMKAKKYEDYESIAYPLLRAEERST